MEAKKYTLIIPMPPSVNAIYKSIVVGKKLIRCKSKVYYEYDKIIKDWTHENFDDLKSVKDQIKTLINTGSVLSIDRYFCFHKESLFTKMDTIKRLDVTNRIKVLDDTVMRLFEIDDKYIWFGYEEKVILSPSDDECVIVDIAPVEMFDYKNVISIKDGKGYKDRKPRITERDSA